MAGLVVMGVALWLLLVPVAAGERSEAAFQRAVPCPSAPAAGGPECISRSDSVISWTRQDSHKNPAYSVAVPGPGGAVRWIALKNAHAFTDRAHRGDSIALYSWRGDVRTVVTGNRSYDTARTPVGSWGTAMGWAAGLFPGGLAVLACGWWWLARGAAHRAAAPWQVGLIGTVGIVTAVFVGVWAGQGPVTVGQALRGAGAAYTAGLLLVLLCWPFLARRERRRGDSIRVTPLHGPAEQVIAVSIPGESRYAGFPYLVVRPDALAMSTDPTGRVGCRPLPNDLSLVRVRRQRRTDPFPYIHAGRSIEPYVIGECHAGENTLLFAGKAKAFDRMAGALAARRPDVRQPA
ncbi:hypothetical protein ABT160_31190 [Streptomyces sp. NPDC001941]|uniref:hypothetical protein n=1 Tax=Streptomyces sp. NPDC001941 TaxID=3154659 RepID=UPI003324C385